MVITAAECPTCGVRVERAVRGDCLPFRAICGSCRMPVILLSPAEAATTNGRKRACLDCGRPIPDLTFSGKERRPLLWVCPACRVHHRQDEPGQDISRFIYLWNRRPFPNGQGGF